MTNSKPDTLTSKKCCFHNELRRDQHEGTGAYLDVWYCPEPQCDFEINLCKHNNQRQGERGSPYCADCGAEVPDSLRPPSETNSSQDARRYAVLRDHIEPRTLYDKLVKNGKSPGTWVDLPREQTIRQKIDELCDGVLSRDELKAAAPPEASIVKAFAQSPRRVACGNPVMHGTERYGPCKQPEGHEGECDPPKTDNALRVGDCLHPDFIPHPDGEVCVSCGMTRAELNGDESHG
jgi:hypothetical protein